MSTTQPPQPPPTPPGLIPFPAAPSRPRPFQLRPLWTPEELAAEDWQTLLSVDWLLEGWIEHGDVVIWAGDPGIGKSLTLLAISVALAAGRRPLEFWAPPPEPLTIAILDLESRSTLLKRRLARLCLGLGLDPAAIIGKTLHPFSLRGECSFSADFERLKAGLLPIKPDLIALDTLFAATNQGDLSPQAGVKFVTDYIFPLAKRAGSGLHIVHHNRKTSNDPRFQRAPGDLNNVSGGGFTGSTDATVMLEQWQDRVVVTNPKQRHRKNPGRYELVMDDGGSDSGPLSLKLINPSDDLSQLCQALDLSREILTAGPVLRSDLSEILAERFSVTPRQGLRIISELIAQGSLSVAPPSEGETSDGPVKRGPKPSFIRLGSAAPVAEGGEG